MPLKIRQKKQEAKQSHPQYQPNTGTHWKDQYREDNRQSFRRSFIAIIAVLVLVVIILIASAVRTVLPTTENVSMITAADTFSITQAEQEQMINDAQTFAEGILVYAYCSDENVALQGKTAAMRLMANNTDSYEKIDQMAPVIRDVNPADLLPVTTTPTLLNATQAYAGTFRYEFDGAVADASVVDEENPDGTFVDAGCHFIVDFAMAEDSEAGTSNWVISRCTIKTK